ncbi:SCO family protein [Sideroxydans lithotrophicus]|uniref:Electron transport protein SCO1/SenC n=1 Tax=Sideroxydans lithotrophicus (strain ES-1) TaxID=580332 RepID=D5CSV6_SIDLE|nr:SCO family protein [Sideroxydans lithotrophicus]ADE12042.1 electron transport protein SCO1/SenC [Sideroxydans lithotrophicus ES-1]
MQSNLTILAAALAIGLSGAAATSAYAHDGMHMEMMDMSGSADVHHAVQKVVRKTMNYNVPRVELVRDDNRTVLLPDEMNDGRPVIMNFIYTTCTSACPLTSHTFQELQAKLGSERNKVHMISISIDPEQDTPRQLAEYAHKYDAKSQWQFYTGTSEASLAAQRAFGVYYGDKMDHTPVTLLRAAPGKAWLRIDGFASADDLLLEYRKLVSTP